MSKPRGLLPIMAYTGMLLPKGVPFSGFRYIEKVGNTVVEVYERVGKSVISVCNKSQKGLTREIYGCDKVEKAVRFCDLFIC